MGEAGTSTSVDKCWQGLHSCTTTALQLHRSTHSTAAQKARADRPDEVGRLPPGAEVRGEHKPLEDVHPRPVRHGPRSGLVQQRGRENNHVPGGERGHCPGALAVSWQALCVCHTRFGVPLEVLPGHGSVAVVCGVCACEWCVCVCVRGVGGVPGTTSGAPAAKDRSAGAANELLCEPGTT